MKSGIYRLFCTASGKSYVGQSKNVDGRLENHFQKLRKNKHDNPHLQSAFNLYGEENFSIEVLEFCSQDELTKREQWWMDYYGLECLYNMCPIAGSTRNRSHSEEARQKISKALNGIQRGPMSEEHRQKLSKSLKGIKLGPQSEEHRKHTKEAWVRRRLNKQIEKDKDRCAV